MSRRTFRPTLIALEPRIALSSNFLSSLFGNIFGTTSSSSSKHKVTHNLAYYEKLAPTNAHAAQVVAQVEAHREHVAEIRAAHAAALQARH